MAGLGGKKVASLKHRDNELPGYESHPTIRGFGGRELRNLLLPRLEDGPKTFDLGAVVSDKREPPWHNPAPLNAATVDSSLR